MARWNDVLRQTSMCRHAWVVRGSAGTVVKEWLAKQSFPTHSDNRLREDMHSSWAFADGGITYAFGDYVTSLPRGFRVIGPLAFRTVVEGLDLQPPRRWPDPIAGVPTSSDEERAPLLNGYSDSEGFRQMVGHVLGLPAASASTAPSA